MTNQPIENFHRLCGEAQRRWDRLTTEQLDEVNGDREKLAAYLEAAYGWPHEQCDEQIREFEFQYRGKIGATRTETEEAHSYQSVQPNKGKTDNTNADKSPANETAPGKHHAA